MYSLHLEPAKMLIFKSKIQNIFWEGLSPPPKSTRLERESPLLHLPPLKFNPSYMPDSGKVHLRILAPPRIYYSLGGENDVCVARYTGL